VIEKGQPRPRDARQAPRSGRACALCLDELERRFPDGCDVHVVHDDRTREQRPHEGEVDRGALVGVIPVDVDEVERTRDPSECLLGPAVEEQPVADVAEVVEAAPDVLARPAARPAVLASPRVAEDHVDLGVRPDDGRQRVAFLHADLQVRVSVVCERGQQLVVEQVGRHAVAPVSATILSSDGCHSRTVPSPSGANVNVSKACSGSVNGTSNAPRRV